MTDTVNAALEGARRPLQPEIFGHGLTKRVRVPGAQMATCKVNGDDREPCILVEVFTPEGDLIDRVLVREVMFAGGTTMVQSVSSPCEVTGAILWLETTDMVTVYPQKRRDA